MRKLVILVAALAVAFFGYIVYRDVAASPIVVVKETVETTAPSKTTTESVPTETTKVKKKKAKATEPTTEATEPEDDYFPFPDEPIYTTMKINKDETDILTINLPASSDVHNIDLRSYNLTAGSYSARLSGGPGADSTPCYFDILDLPISVSESGNNITVTFDKDKDPRYIQVCIRNGAARCVVPLTKEDIAAGSKTFNISEVIAAQRSVVTNKQDNYVIVLYGVTDPGGYKLVRATDFIKLDWTDQSSEGSDETDDEDEDPD